MTPVSSLVCQYFPLLLSLLPAPTPGHIITLYPLLCSLSGTHLSELLQQQIGLHLEENLRERLKLFRATYCPIEFKS